MERGRAGSPVYARQKSISSSSGAAPSSPMMSPMHRHVRSGSGGVANFRRPQNYAARAAAQRLARVMAHQPAGDDSSEDDEDDDLLDAPPVGLSTPRRAARTPSPSASPAIFEDEFITLPRRWKCGSHLSKLHSDSRDEFDKVMLGRYLADQSPAVRSTSAGRPSMVAKPTALIPPIKPSSRPFVASSAPETTAVSRREKRMSVDLGNLNVRVSGHPHSSSALPDEIVVQQEENENVLEKLRLAEEKCQEAEARVRQHEKQVASFGEGVSLEARLLTRNGSALQQKEAALKAAAQNNDVKKEEIAALVLEAKIARDEATFVVEHLQESDSEIKSLRTMAQKMILTQEEMEEMVLKRCWLARYWKLCVQHGIHADIAESKHEYWSSLAPTPLEVLLYAGQKARDGYSSDKLDVEEDKVPWDMSNLVGEGNIESMLIVEKGLRELASLKVEDAVLLAMTQHRHGNVKSGSLLSMEGQNAVEAFELSQEESEDVLVKQAWLTYFWRRVKNHGLEDDIADDRLQFWIDQSTQTPTSHSAVEVERGLLELKKLGIESLLWEASRNGTDQDSSNRGSRAESEL